MCSHNHFLITESYLIALHFMESEIESDFNLENPKDPQKVYESVRIRFSLRKSKSG